MLPYAAYLRIYEPLTAFPEPQRSHWAGYAASREVRAFGGAVGAEGKSGVSPGRHAQHIGHLGMLEAEHSETLQRIIAVPPIVAPSHESGHAYVRRADGVIYICPWQTRLRSWLALGRLRATLPPALADTFVPRHLADLAASDFPDPAGPGPGGARRAPSRDGNARAAGGRLSAAAAEIEDVGKWLEDFHPRALVELDYGGLVHPVDDEALRSDQSVAEVSAAVTGLETGELELALAMYQRLRDRWRPMRATESASSGGRVIGEAIGNLREKLCSRWSTRHMW